MRDKLVLVVLSLLVVAGGVSAKEFLVGADISALATLEEWGAVYRKDGVKSDAIELLKEGGYNAIRLRLFVNPKNENVVTNDLDYTIKLARRVKEHGMKFMLDFHYSDTWADPGHQSKPKEWEELSFLDLKRKVKDYTQDVILAFKKEGLLPEYVQVGNEITPGFLWPDGKLGGDDEKVQARKFALLVKAGIDGVRQVAGKDDTRIIIHIDRGSDNGVTRWFWDQIREYDLDYDIVGLSYYPFWNGDISELKANMEYISKELKKDIIVAETAFRHKWSEGKEVSGFEENTKGQYDFLYALTEAVLDVSSERGIGVFYWYPESIAIKDKRVWFDGAMALFDEDGEAKPGIRACADAVNSRKK